MEMTDRRLFLQTYSLAQSTGAIVERELYAVGLPSFLFGLLSQVHRLQPVAPTRIAAAPGTPLTKATAGCLPAPAGTVNVPESTALPLVKRTSY